MKASTKRILSIGVAFLFIVGALLVYQNLIRPLGEEIDKKRAEASAKGELFEKQSQAVQQAQDLIERSKNLGAIEDTVSLAIPNKPEITSALSQIETIARLNNVILSGLDVKSIVPRKTGSVLIKDLGVVEVSINISGAYGNIKALLRSLETNVRVANIKEFNFRTAAGGSGLYSINLVVEFYYQNI